MTHSKKHGDKCPKVKNKFGYKNYRSKKSYFKGLFKLKKEERNKRKKYINNNPPKDVEENSMSMFNEDK